MGSVHDTTSLVICCFQDKLSNFRLNGVLYLRTETLVYSRSSCFHQTRSILNKQLRTADKGWSSSLVDGRSAVILLNINFNMLRYAARALGFERVFQNDIYECNEKLTRGLELAV